MSNPFSLENKTILITGSSSGIGRSIAIECSKLGAKLILTGRNVDRLNQTLDLMVGNGHIILPADLTKEESILELTQNCPLIDGLVHNAGVGIRVLSKSIKEKDIDAIMHPNFYGPILLQKYLTKTKRIKNGSSIVFISSRAPFAPSVGNGLYAASKAAIIGYAKSLGLEVAPHKIRVNCICPAMVWTDLIDKEASIMGVDYSEIQKKYPLKRFGRPEDVAYLTIYLLSEASNWMTGSCIDITGGGELTLV